MHDILHEIEFKPDLTIDCLVSCPLESEKFVLVLRVGFGF